DRDRPADQLVAGIGGYQAVSHQGRGGVESLHFPHDVHHVDETILVDIHGGCRGGRGRAAARGRCQAVGRGGRPAHGACRRFGRRRQTVAVYVGDKLDDVLNIEERVVVDVILRKPTRAAGRQERPVLERFDVQVSGTEASAARGDFLRALASPTPEQ